MSNANNYRKNIRAFMVRLPNRRVKGAQMEDGTISFLFMRLMPDHTIQRESIRLTREAVMAMFSIMAKFDTPRKKLAEK